MPTYQYSCTECGHFFEQFQSFSEDSLTVCPQCEGRLRKVFNAVGVVFKGSGFYRTDSRAGAGSDGGSGSSASATDGASPTKGSGSGQKSASGAGEGSGGGSASGTSATSSGSSTSAA